VIAAVPLPARRLLIVLAAASPFIGAVALAPRTGVSLVLALEMLAGPVAVATWLILTRPTATLVALYIGLAPVDFLLSFSGGFTITRLIGMAAVGALLFGLLARGANRTLPGGVVAWLAALTWMVVTLMWSGDPPKTIERLISTGLPLLIVTLVALSKIERKDVEALFVATVGVAAAISAYAVIAHPPAPSKFTGENAARLWLSNNGASIDPNGLAFSLLTPLAVALAAALGSGSRFWRIAGFVAAPFIAAAVLATESRGGLLGMAAVLIWMTLRSRNRLIAGGILAAGLVVSVVQGGAWSRLFSHSGTDAEGAGRLPIWETGVLAFKNHWLIGNGYGAFTDAFNQAYLQVPHHFHIGWSREAHNIVLASFVELGVFGGALVLYAWWRQFRQLRTISPEDPDAWLRVALEASILSVFITGFFLDILVLKPAWVAPILIAAVWAMRSASGAQVRARTQAARVSVWTSATTDVAGPTNHGSTPTATPRLAEVIGASSRAPNI